MVEVSGSLIEGHSELFENIAAVKVVQEFKTLWDPHGKYENLHVREDIADGVSSVSLSFEFQDYDYLRRSRRSDWEDREVIVGVKEAIKSTSIGIRLVKKENIKIAERGLIHIPEHFEVYSNIPRSNLFSQLNRREDYQRGELLLANTSDAQVLNESIRSFFSKDFEYRQSIGMTPEGIEKMQQKDENFQKLISKSENGRVLIP